MLPIHHLGLPCDIHVTNLRGTSGKQPAVKQFSIRGSGKIRIVTIKHQPVSPVPYRQFPDCCPTSLSASRQCLGIDQITHRRSLNRSKSVAALITESLPVLKPA